MAACPRRERLRTALFACHTTSMQLSYGDRCGLYDGTFIGSAALADHIGMEFGTMAAQFPAATPPHVLLRRRPARRLPHDTVLALLCWLTAASGLAGSYWLEPLAWQAASCVVGLASAVVALALTIMANGR